MIKPDLIVYVDEAVAGNDDGAAEFDRTVGADAIVLTKADMDSRGGAAISIAHTIGKPLLFLPGPGRRMRTSCPSAGRGCGTFWGVVWLMDSLSDALKDALKTAGKAIVARTSSSMEAKASPSAWPLTYRLTIWAKSSTASCI